MRKRVAAGCIGFLFLLSCSLASGSPVTGKWKITSKGVDGQNNPCPFIPDELEFTKDGKVFMSNMPGMAMSYKVSLSPDEANAILAKFPYVKDRDHALLMMPPGQSDWTRNAMAYHYSVTAGELILEMPGWSPSRYSRSR